MCSHGAPEGRYSHELRDGRLLRLNFGAITIEVSPPRAALQ
jgi:hypothetical protein